MRRWFVLAGLLSVSVEARQGTPAPVTETITVTAARTETRLADTPASVVVLDATELRRAPAPTLDDALRQVAGFTLFRRTGSRVANPTSQGVSLRGVGASGASRALVLDDGVPLNDPFGGWVYWGRVPRAALDRAEVLRGGASDLYGSSAMGGVIQFVRRKTPAVAVDASAGSQSTGNLSAFAGIGVWSIAADLLSTDGYVLVRPEDRGTVDVEADSKHAALDATFRGRLGFARASWYDESRGNGTPLQKNDTTHRQLAAGLDLGAFTIRGWASDQDYFQTFSAIADDRSSERLTVEQSVPSRGAGGSVQWTRPFGSRNVVLAGADGRYAHGTSDETRYTANGIFDVSAGGTQRTAAAWLEDLFAVTPALSISAALRTDWWRNEGQGLQSTEGQLNPRVAVLWRVQPELALSASAYSAFRAPTLNELYRGFRVGNVNTLPNAGLRSENLTGYELGARFRGTRVALFSMHVDDSITNVTLIETPSLITRQRQNSGTTTSRGVELDGEWTLRGGIRTSASWLFADARTSEGKRVPQVPRNQVTAQLTWREYGLQGRWSGMQFDDDRNELPLAGYFVVDAFASHPLFRGVDVTLALENVFNEDVEASATPVITLGQPRAAHVGLRYSR